MDIAQNCWLRILNSVCIKRWKEVKISGNDNATVCFYKKQLRSYDQETNPFSEHSNQMKKDLKDKG